MDTPDKFNLKDYGIDVGLLISGLFGAILLTSKSGAYNLTRTVSCLLAGAASANYVTPLIVSLTKLNESHYHYSIAFFLGFLGLKGVEMFTEKFIPEMHHTIVIENSEDTKKKIKRIKPLRVRKSRIAK